MLFRKDIDPRCAYCARGSRIGDDKVACVKGCPTGAKYFDDPGYLYHKSELEEVYARPANNEVFL